VAASGSVATDYLHYGLYTPKNGKLPSVRQSHFFNGAPFSPFSPADATKVEQAVTHLINVKALRFHPCLCFLVESIVGVVELFLSYLYKEAKTFNKMKLCFRCYYVLVQLIEFEAFRKAECSINPAGIVTAFALSFFPQGFFSVRAEKKS